MAVPMMISMLVQAMYNIVDSIFDHDLKNASSHTIHYGHIKYNQEVIDEVLIPYSFAFFLFIIN